MFITIKFWLRAPRVSLVRPNYATPDALLMVAALFYVQAVRKKFAACCDKK